jgi:outer membrane protein assembly factor BamC
MKFKHLSQYCVAALLPLALVGCSSLGLNRGIDYKTASSARQTPLEVPPELTTPQVDDRFAIPAARAGTATFSQYNRNQPTQPVAAGVLPQNARATVQRNADGRFLVVKLEPDKVWPVVREFWVEMGFILKLDSQSSGVMETEWAENRARIPQDPIRSTIGRVFDAAWSTSERDKFRTRLERAADGSTEVYVTHRGVQELYVSEGKDQTRWQPRAADRELEAEMLNRIMVKFGGDPTQATPAVAAATGGAAAAGAAAPAVSAVLEENGTRIRISDPFDRAWRRVGLALDRGGFTVEDRDRTKGTFFVRYVDPDYSISTEGGWVDKLKFWKSAPKPGDRPAYRIIVADAGNIANVTVQDPSGKADTSATGKRMLTVLLDQLK